MISLQGLGGLRVWEHAGSKANCSAQQKEEEKEEKKVPGPNCRFQWLAGLQFADSVLSDVDMYYHNPQPPTP